MLAVKTRTMTGGRMVRVQCSSNVPGGTVTGMASSHRRHGQDTTVGDVNCRQVKAVETVSPISKCVADYWKQS